jgi:hypothetical protein
VTLAAGMALQARLVALGLTLAVPSVPLAAQGQSDGTHPVTHPEDSKRSVGKSETITGTLSGVDPEKGIIIVTRRGPHEPPSLQLSWTETVSTDTGGHVEKSPITVSQGPGETAYDFRVTNSTSIQMNGSPASLKSLAAFPNAKTKVRFTPKRDGNFAFEITVSH